MSASPPPSWIHTLLRKGDRYFKIDMVYLATSGFWLSVGQFVSTVTVFVLAIAFANLVPKEIYGTYKYVISFMGLISLTTLSGINTYIAQAIARGAERTFLTGMNARIRSGYWGAGATALIAVYYTYLGNLTLGGAFLVAALFVPFADALGLYNVYLQSKKLFKKSILYFCLVQVLSTAALLATLLLTHNVILLIAAYFAPPTFIRALVHFRTLKTVPPNTVDDPAVVRYGTHLSIVGVLGNAAAYIDSILLFHLLGPIQVAVYSFALAPTDQLRALYSKNLTPIALPKLAHRSFTEINQTLRTRMFFLSVIGLVVTAAYFLVVPWAFRLFFPQYLDAIPYSQALAALLIVSLPATWLATALQSKLSHVPPAWLYWAAVPDALHLIALALLLPLCGIYGIVIAKLLESLSGLVISGTQWFLLVRRHP